MRLPNPLNGSGGTTRGGRMAEANRRKQRRSDAYVHVCDAIGHQWRSPSRAEKIRVQITRISNGKLDAWDGLPASCKNVIDGIADAFGARDDNPRFEWLSPQQRKAGAGVFHVEIEIEIVEEKGAAA